MEFWSWFWDFISDPYSWWASEARYYILLAIVFVFLVCWKLWSMTKGTFEIVSTKETNGRLIIEFTFSAKKRLLSKKMKATLQETAFFSKRRSQAPASDVSVGIKKLQHAGPVLSGG